jgi:hypothetical protein
MYAWAYLLKNRCVKVAMNVTSMISPTNASKAASTVSGSSSKMLFPGKKPRPWKHVILNTKAPRGENAASALITPIRTRLGRSLRRCTLRYVQLLRNPDPIRIFPVEEMSTDLARKKFPG